MSIDVKDLSFAYGKRQVLRQVSFRTSPGQLVAVLGPNGAGKSTLFRCILGFLPRYQGDIALCGHALRSLDRRALARLAAYIPQSSAPVYNYTVRDTVLMGAAGGLEPLRQPGRQQLETAQRINELAADINRLTVKETQLRSEQAALRPWRSLDVPLELTETEFSILHCLAENRGRVVPVRTIYETVWHETYMPASNNTVMVHIVNLRKKLEEDPANPRLIRTVWGKGYQID